MNLLDNITFVWSYSFFFSYGKMYFRSSFRFLGEATEIKAEVGKDKEYKSPEYFAYDDMSFYDIEKSVVDQRCEQPKSGLTEYW